MGEHLIACCKDKIKKEWTIAFYAAFLSCLLIHIYKFTNTLPCHDSFYNVYSDQDMTISGRWFLQYACGISSYFDLPWINGLLCAVYLGFTAAIVAELFELKNPVVIVLAAVVLSATPSTTETLYFGFTADGYLLGLMLSALAACFSCKGKTWQAYIGAGVCLCLSCGIYQAYISFALVLCIFYLVLRLLNSEISVRDSWKWIGKHALIYVAALAAYYGIWKLVLSVTGQTATANQGINEVGRIGMSTLVGGVVKSVKNILFYFLEWNVLENPITLYAVLNILFLLCLSYVVVIAIVKSKIWKNTAGLLTVLLCLVACVPVISIWCFLSDGVQYRPMMMHSASLLFILGIILFDKWANKRVSTAFGLLIAVICFNCGIMANISYFYMDKCYARSYYIGSQMMDRIEQAQIEYGNEIASIAFVGSLAEDVVLADTAPGNRIHLLGTMLEDHLLYDHDHAYRYLHHVYGMELPEPTDRSEIEANADVQEMQVWPSADALKVIDGILVIKLAD